MTVWAVNKSQEHDTSSALQYGDIRHISPRYVYGDEIEGGLMPQEVRQALVAAAAQFNPHKDYVLITGDHLQLLQFVALIADFHRGRQFQVLRYDKKAKGYIPVCITF